MRLHINNFKKKNFNIFSATALIATICSVVTGCIVNNITVTKAEKAGSLGANSSQGIRINGKGYSTVGTTIGLPVVIGVYPETLNYGSLLYNGGAEGKRSSENNTKLPIASDVIDGKGQIKDQKKLSKSHWMSIYDEKTKKYYLKPDTSIIQDMGQNTNAFQSEQPRKGTMIFMNQFSFIRPISGHWDDKEESRNSGKRTQYNFYIKTNGDNKDTNHETRTRSAATFIDGKKAILFPGKANNLNGNREKYANALYDHEKSAAGQDKQYETDVNFMQKNIFDKYKYGIFSEKIHSFYDDDCKKSIYKNGIDTGKKVCDVYKLFTKISKKDNLNKLLDYAEKSDQKNASELLMALQCNLYQKGGKRYNDSMTLQYYRGMVIYKYLNKKDSRPKNDIDRIISTANEYKIGKKSYKESTMKNKILNSKADTSAYRNVTLQIQHWNGKDNDTTHKAATGDRSQVMTYIAGEDMISYLDILCCGYSAACQIGGKNGTAAKAWKTAITDYLDSSISKSNNTKLVAIKTEPMGVMALGKNNNVVIANAGTYAQTTYNLGPNASLTERRDNVNDKSLSKGFIGIQGNVVNTKKNGTGKNTFKSRHLVARANRFKSYQGVYDMGNWYDRVRKAAQKNHKNANSAVEGGEDWYALKWASDLIDISRVKLGRYGKYTSKGGWNMHLGDIIKQNGIADITYPADKKPVSYFTFMLTPALNSTQFPHGVGAEFECEMRIYSSRAHNDNLGKTKDSDKDRYCKANNENAKKDYGNKEKFQATNSTGHHVYGKNTVKNKDNGLVMYYGKENSKNEKAKRDKKGGSEIHNTAEAATFNYDKYTVTYNFANGKPDTPTTNGTGKMKGVFPLQDYIDTNIIVKDRKSLQKIETNDTVKKDKLNPKSCKITIQQKKSLPKNVQEEFSDDNEYQNIYTKSYKSDATVIKLDKSILKDYENKINKKAHFNYRDLGGTEYYGVTRPWEHSANYGNISQRRLLNGADNGSIFTNVKIGNYKWYTKDKKGNADKKIIKPPKNGFTSEVQAKEWCSQNGIKIKTKEDGGWSASISGEARKTFILGLRAKITMKKKNGKPLVEDDGDGDHGWKNGTFTTNWVYVSYTVKQPVSINIKSTIRPTPRYIARDFAITTQEKAFTHAYAEFKEGSVYNETFEAMAGVPSTRTMYFATGGEEFIINLQALYDDYVAHDGTSGIKGGNPDAYTSVRKYTVHFNGVDCEYKQGDTFKAGNGARSDAPAETFAANSSDKQTPGDSQVRQHNSAYEPVQGMATGLSKNVTTIQHESPTKFYAKWSGTIRNETTKPSDNSGSFNAGHGGSPCEGKGYDEGNGDSRFMQNESTKWDVNMYNDSLEKAIDWAKKMEATSKDANGTVWRWDDSDGAKRVYHVGKADIVISISGGSPSCSLEPGTRSSSNVGPKLGDINGTWNTGNASGKKLNSSDRTKLGVGWTWNEGHNGKGGGYVEGCGHGCTKQWDTPPSKDDSGVAHTHTHECGYYNPGQNMTSGKTSDYSYTITVTFHDGKITSEFKDGNTSNGEVSCGEKGGLSEIPAHAMCGPCCQHHLRDITDTWVQKLRYDTVRFSAVKVWKLDDGYAVDMSSIKKKTGGDGTGAEKWGPGGDYDLTQAPGSADWDGTTAITGDEADYVRSKIVRHDPNIFYNIAQANTSKAGRLRYSLQTGQDDNVYYEEMGNEGDDYRAHGLGFYRSDRCDGTTGSHGSSPVKVNASGHKKTFCTGCLYDNPHPGADAINTMNWHDNAKEWLSRHDQKSRSDGGQYSYKGWEVDDPNKAEPGKLAETKTGYTSDSVDKIDKTTQEWKRINDRRHQKNRVKVISDFLILQTSSGNQSVFYWENKTNFGTGQNYLEAEAQENFSDDFWYSKPVADSGCKKISGKRGSEYLRYCMNYENVNGAQNAWEQMFTNNPLAYKFDHVNIGGYNGKYNQTSTKYKGEGHDEHISTAFDQDSAYFNGDSKDDGGYGSKVMNGDLGIKSRPAENIDVQMNLARSMHWNSTSMMENGNLCSPGCGNTLDTGTYGSVRMNTNDGDIYKAPTKKGSWGDMSWLNRITDPGTARFGNADLVLLQDGISMNPTNKNQQYYTGQSYAFYKPILTYHNKEADYSCDESKYDSYPDDYQDTEEAHEDVDTYEFPLEDDYDQYLNETGVTIESKYADEQWSKVNDIIIHDPVSVSESFVRGADSKWDQRIYGDYKANAEDVRKEEESNEKCPGTAEDCIYRVLNCKYANRIRKAAFSIDNASRSSYDEDDPDSGTYDTIYSEVMTNGSYASEEITGTGFSIMYDDGREYNGENENTDDNGASCIIQI